MERPFSNTAKILSTKALNPMHIAMNTCKQGHFSGITGYIQIFRL